VKAAARLPVAVRKDGGSAVRRVRTFFIKVKIKPVAGRRSPRSKHTQLGRKSHPIKQYRRDSRAVYTRVPDTGVPDATAIASIVVLGGTAYVQL